MHQIEACVLTNADQIRKNSVNWQSYLGDLFSRENIPKICRGFGGRDLDEFGSIECIYYFDLASLVDQVATIAYLSIAVGMSFSSDLFNSARRALGISEAWRGLGHPVFREDGSRWGSGGLLSTVRGLFHGHSIGQPRITRDSYYRGSR